MTYAKPVPPTRLPRSDSAAWAVMWESGAWSAATEEPAAELPPQVDAAYRMLRDGYTEVQIRLAIQEQYGKSARPNLAFKNALDLVIQEQRAQREHLPELVMAIRFTAIQRAIASGQLSAAASMLRDAGASCGEGALDASGATLLVEVLQPGSGAPGGLPEGSQDAPAAA